MINIREINKGGVGKVQAWNIYGHNRIYVYIIIIIITTTTTI